jgi:hypothetical protein
MLGPADRQLSDLPQAKRTAQQEQPAKVLGVLCSLTQYCVHAQTDHTEMGNDPDLAKQCSQQAAQPDACATCGLQEVSSEVPSQLARKVRLPSPATSCEFHPKLPSLLLSEYHSLPQMSCRQPE